MSDQIVVGSNHPELLKFVEDRINNGKAYIKLDPATARCVALVDLDVPLIKAVVVLDHWTTHYCEALVASDCKGEWIQPVFMNAIFDYVFNQAGKVRIHAVTESDNVRAIRMYTKMGVKQEGVLRDWFGEGQDGLAYAITKRDWIESKWYPALNKEQPGVEA